MSFWDSITSIIDKFTPSRKAASIDQLNDLTADYQKALKEGNDTLAATLKVQLKNLRKKLGYTDGDV
jgi:hypothetical protein